MTSIPRLIFEANRATAAFERRYAGREMSDRVREDVAWRALMVIADLLDQGCDVQIVGTYPDGREGHRALLIVTEGDR